MWVNWHSKVVTNQSSRSYKKSTLIHSRKNKNKTKSERQMIGLLSKQAEYHIIEQPQIFLPLNTAKMKLNKTYSDSIRSFCCVEYTFRRNSALSPLWLTHSRKCNGPRFMALLGVHADWRAISVRYAILTSWRCVENPGKST